MSNKISPPLQNIPSYKYDKAYVDWKGWDPDNFGELTTLMKHYYDAEIGKTRAFSEKPLRVLEIGFGNGSFLTYCRNRGWDIVATEVNSDLVELARESNFKAICIDNLTAFEDNAFDMVVAFDVLEHISQNHILNFLREAQRILKNDGIFVARCPNGDSPFSLWNQNGDITHVSFIGSYKVRYFASELGAKIVYLGGEAQPLITGSSLLTIYRMFAVPIRKLINLLINLLFFPKANIAFCSSSLVMIFRAVK